MGTKIKLKRTLPAIKYGGSCIQQNYSEKLNGHGFLKWNVQNKNAELIELKNNYGFITLSITDKDYIPVLKNIPKHPRIKIQVDHLLLPHIKEITKNVKKLYNVNDIVISVVNSNTNQSLFTDNNSIGNISNINYQNSLLKDYIELTTDITSEIMQLVLQINENLNATLKTSEYNLGGSIKFKKLEFSNLFSYTENNVINFDTLNGVIGLFAPNAHGKSSLIEIILFLLHDSTPRVSKTLDILNINKKEFYAKLTLEINGLTYVIEKYGKKRFFSGKDLLPVTCNFWVETSDGDVKMLNGEDRRYTVNTIESYVGSLLDSTLTSFSIQNDNTGLINATNAERKNLLSSFLGLDIFNKLYVIATQEAKNIETLLQYHNNVDYDDSIKNEIKTQRENKRLYKEIEQNMKQNNTKIASLRKSITNLNIKIINNIDSSLNLQELESNKINLDNEIKNINDNIALNETNILNIKKLIKDATEAINLYDINVLTQKNKDYKLLLSNKLSLQHTIDKLNINISNQLDKLNKLKDLAYDKECKFCMDNIFVKDAILTKETYESSLATQTKLNADINDINTKIDELKKYELQLTAYNELNIKLSTYNKELFQYSNIDLRYKNKLILETNKLNDIIKKIQTYHSNISAIASNKLIQSEIDNLIKQLEILEQNNIDYNKMLMQYNTAIELSTAKYYELIDKKAEYNTLFLKDKAYSYYINAINKNGIQFNLIKRVIPIFEIEINNVLSQLVDFNINVIVDEKYIDFQIKYSDKCWPLELASGMEKFISSIAIRNALMMISTKPKPNYFIIDEGFSNLDATNLAQLYLLFNYLRNQYDLILIISHNDTIKDFVDDLIFINKNNDGSFIKF